MTIPLRPPRATGDPAVDSAGSIEYLWLWYRTIVEEQEYVRNEDANPDIINDDQLAALAALTPSATLNLPYFTSETAAALTELSEFARELLADGSDSAMRGTLGLGALAILDSISAAFLDTNSVTYDKIQQVPQDRILGRQTASTGDVEEIVCTSAGRDLLDDASTAAQRVTLGIDTTPTSVAVNTSLTDAIRSVFVTATGKTMTLPAAATIRIGLDWSVVLGTIGYVDIVPAGSDTFILPDGETAIRLDQKGAFLTLRCLSATTWGIV